jgi:hypothetical protein
MSIFAIAVVIILLSGIAFLLVALWAMLIVAGRADDRMERYWQSLEDSRQFSSGRLGLLNGGKSARNG